jgi:hypothetical protein
MGEDASEERNLFTRSRESTAAYVASDLGVVRVDLAPDRIGEFSLVERCNARGVAAGDALVAVATPEEVLLDRGDGFTDRGFGDAVAVGVDGGTVYAAAPGGEIGRLDASAESSDSWEAVGTAGEPRRFDGALLAAGDGVYRVGDGLEPLGLGSAEDVAAAGPYAASGDGLFRRTDGDWQQEYEGAASIVAADGERAHAVGKSGLLERVSDESAGDATRWERLATPGNAVPVDLAYGACLYAVTAAGEFLLAAKKEQATDGQGGWRTRTLGVRGVTGLAVLG